MKSGVKPLKQTVFVAKSTKKQFLLTNSGVLTSILRVSGLELHSSNTKSNQIKSFIILAVIRRSV